MSIFDFMKLPPAPPAPPKPIPSPANAIYEGETFREFYTRTTGSPWPAVRGEELQYVWPRIANAVADWCDLLEKGRSKKP